MLASSGPSAALQIGYDGLREILSELRTTEGDRVIGEPIRQQDASEIRFRMHSDLQRLVVPRAWEVIRQHVGREDASIRLSPSLITNLLPADEQFQERISQAWKQTTLETGFGTEQTEGWSSARLRSRAMPT